jgi:Phosphodiester glycosidase
MTRTLTLATLSLALAAGTALGAPVEVAPSVTLERLERPGPQVVHVMRVSQGPLTSVKPILTSGSPTRRERLSTAIGALRPIGAVAGMNGDFFNIDLAYPSGATLIDGELASEPEPTRSATLFGVDGRISIPRLELTGRWQAVDPAGVTTFEVRTFNGTNRPAERGTETILYTPRFGAATPSAATNSRYEAAVQLDPGQTPIINTALTGTVVATGVGGGLPIGAGQVVMTGVGSSGPAVVNELAVGRRVNLRIDVPAVPAGVTNGIGGGPILVSGGVPIPAAGEGFTSAQLTGLRQRSAIGQKQDGTLLLVTTEGVEQGSRGVSTAEQAALMAELGAVEAMAMDAGGSAIMVVDDDLVVPWASERAITTALAVFHKGVSVAPLAGDRVSPNGDRVNDTISAEVRVPVKGNLAVTLVRRGGGAVGTVIEGATGEGVRAIGVNPARLKLGDGPYALVARLTPDDGSSPTEHRRKVIIDRTLGGLKLRPQRSGKKKELLIRFALTRPARATVRILDANGKPLRTLMSGRPLRTGPQSITWDRSIKRVAAKGTFTIEVDARNSYGRSVLARTVVLT